MKTKLSPFAGVSFAMIVGVMGTALISPLYGLYQMAWQLKASDVSTVYVVYMGGALCGLLFLGRLPDRIGFRPFMQAGLAVTLLGTALCMVAKSTQLLMVGRVLVGLSSSMLVTSSTLGLAMLSPRVSSQRVATLTGFLMAFGFGLGPLVGGIMGQWAPFPLVSTYVPTLVLGAMGVVVISRLKLPVRVQKASMPMRWQDVVPTLTWPQPPLRGAFALTTSLPFFAFGVFGLYAAMSPLFLDKLVPWHGPVVSGSAIAFILLASACIQIWAGRLPTHVCGAAGMLLLALSNAVLMVNLWVGSGWLFGCGVLLTAAGHAMSMLAGMSMVNHVADARNRSGLLATYLMVGYVGSMAPMMAMGWVADRWGMNTAVSVFCGTVVLGAGAVAWAFYRHTQVQSFSMGGKAKK